MIDIKDLRERPDVYRRNNEKKGREIEVIDNVLRLDEEWRKVKVKADQLRSERNKVSESINQFKKQGKDIKDLIRKAKELPELIRKTEEEEQGALEQLNRELYKIPNLMHPSVPVGENDKQNVVRKVVGKPKAIKNAKNHVELSEALGVADYDASAKVIGNGFYYLKGDLALLNQALIRYAIEFMAKKKYTYIEPPLMMSKKVAAAAGDLAAFQNALYKIDGEESYLIPTAEHAILGMLSEKTIDESKLPLKLYGYSMSFRKEVGSHGINEKGLWRTHQFNKVEQFIFCKPEDSWKYYDELKKNSEELIKSLGLPYRVIECCTGDLGDWKAKSEDIEVWRPTTNSYGEVGSLSNCTDFQARKLDIRGVDKHGNRYVLHTLNNTALATSRIMVTILENYQQKDGTIKVPSVLVKYMGKKVIGVKKEKKTKEKKDIKKKSNKKEKKSVKKRKKK